MDLDSDNESSSSSSVYSEGEESDSSEEEAVPFEEEADSSSDSETSTNFSESTRELAKLGIESRSDSDSDSDSEEEETVKPGFLEFVAEESDSEEDDSESSDEDEDEEDDEDDEEEEEEGEFGDAFFEGVNQEEEEEEESEDEEEEGVDETKGAGTGFLSSFLGQDRDEEDEDEEEEDEDDEEDEDEEDEKKKEEDEEEEEEEEEDPYPFLLASDRLRIKQAFEESTDAQRNFLYYPQFCLMLTMLGEKLSAKESLQLFNEHKEGGKVIKLEAVLALLNRIRNLSNITVDEIQDAFDEMYYGTLINGEEQKDVAGKRYLLARELRLALTSYGDPLTDEEAERIIYECRPDDQGRIFYDQYKAMLLDTTL